MRVEHKRHKWNFNPIKKIKDSSSSACERCGCVRQYIAGKATYFINDTVYLKSPICSK